MPNYGLKERRKARKLERCFMRVTPQSVAVHIPGTDVTVSSSTWLERLLKEGRLTKKDLLGAKLPGVE
jgi:hypothetical protein